MGCVTGNQGQRGNGLELFGSCFVSVMWQWRILSSVIGQDYRTSPGHCIIIT